jgi:hypothetical protein
MVLVRLLHSFRMDELSNMSHANPNHEALVSGYQGITRGEASNLGCTNLRTYESPSHPGAIFP